jgi:F420-dependent oxidoreductase-like protein
MLISAKLAPVFDYDVLVDFWTRADELGYAAVWNYDHFLGLGATPEDLAKPTLEGWTTLAAMAVHVKRARIGCMVTGVTYRHPAVLAKMAVTLDHISHGRLEFGIGAAWHQAEHDAFGIAFPSPGTRVAMLDDALRLMKAFWADERTYRGSHYTLSDAVCSPLPVQRPHPPIVVGGGKPKMLRVVAAHADEWNIVATTPEDFAARSRQIDEICAEIGRDPKAIRRGVQLFLHPDVEGQVDEELAKIKSFEDAGCEHAVLSFYHPPSPAILEKAAPR